MKLNMIWAETSDRVIGVDGHLPWGYLSEDIKRFRRLTLGCVVIMGRKTWDSLPVEHRPLKGRFNIILTSNYHPMPQPNVMRSTSIPAALELASDIIKLHSLSDTVWIIGGSEVFNKVLESYGVDELHVTHVPMPSPEGQHKQWAPIIKKDVFPEVRTEYVDSTLGQLKFSVYRYVLANPAPAPAPAPEPTTPSLKSSVSCLSFLYGLMKAEAELNGVNIQADSPAFSLSTSGASAVVSFGQMDVLVEALNTLVESETPMAFDPATGAQDCTPDTPTAYRKHHGEVAWLFNPWTGQRRDARDVGSDTFGQALVAEGWSDGTV